MVTTAHGESKFQFVCEKVVLGETTEKKPENIKKASGSHGHASKKSTSSIGSVQGTGPDKISKPSRVRVPLGSASGNFSYRPSKTDKDRPSVFKVPELPGKTKAMKYEHTNHRFSFGEDLKEGNMQPIPVKGSTVIKDQRLEIPDWNNIPATSGDGTSLYCV